MGAMQPYPEIKRCKCTLYTLAASVPVKQGFQTIKTFQIQGINGLSNFEFALFSLMISSKT